MNQWDIHLPDNSQVQGFQLPEGTYTTSTPLELQVETSYGFGMRGPLSGPGKLILTPQMMRLQFGKKTVQEVQFPWHTVRQLQEELSTERFFTVNVVGGNRQFLLEFRVVSGDIEALQSLLAALPEETYLPRCLRCGGTVRGSACSTCGADARTVHRKRGLFMTLCGMALVCVGIGGTFLSHEMVGRTGGFYHIYWWPVLSGVVVTIIGIAKMLFGV